MTTHDPIADHVNLLLQQYFSTQTPNADTSDQGVPMITYDDENNSIVMEYLSPDGSTSSFTKPHPNDHSEPEQEAGQAVPNFFPQPDNTDTALLPILNSSSKSAMEVLDRVFEPSKTPGMHFLTSWILELHILQCGPSMPSLSIHTFFILVYLYHFDAVKSAF